MAQEPPDLARTCLVVGVVTVAGGAIGARSTGFDGVLTEVCGTVRLGTEWVGNATADEALSEVPESEDSTSAWTEPDSEGAAAAAVGPGSGFEKAFPAPAPVLVAAGACAAKTNPSTPAAAADATAVVLVKKETRRRPASRTAGRWSISPTCASELVSLMRRRGCTQFEHCGYQD